MIESNSLQDFIKSIYAFETQIKVNGMNSASLFERAVQMDPRLIVYVKKYATQSSMVSTIYEFGYINKDVAPKDIIVVRSVSETESVIVESAGKYMRRVVIVGDKSIDIERGYYDFHKFNAGFYSNLVSTEVNVFDFMGKTALDVHFSYRMGRVLLSMWDRETNAEVARLKRELFVIGMTPEQKALVAHNYLASTVSYWTKPVNNPTDKSCMQSAYGALIKKECVCQGFAEAYKRLLDGENGVKCYFVMGKIVGSMEGHAWNIITFDEKEYFHVDVTWDASQFGRPTRKYFALGDKEMLKERSWTRMSEWVCPAKTNIKQVLAVQNRNNQAVLMRNGLNMKWLEV